jgi:hypothetical protein
MHVPSLHAGGAARRHRLQSSSRASVPHAPAVERDSGVRVARAVTALVALATALLFVLWTLAALGYADATWWPAALVVATSLVAALAAWIIARVP